MDNSQPKNNVGKIALILGVIFFISVITSYIWKFHGTTISGDPGHWGVFGDFVGGIVNPLLGLVTIWLLTVSLHQNNEMLDQARAELKATLEELKRGQEIQAATEYALKQQIALAESARDIEGAIKLIQYWQTKHDTILQVERDEIHQARINNRNELHIETIKEKYRQQLLHTLEKVGEFDHIIGYEAKRLLKKYPTFKGTFE